MCGWRCNTRSAIPAPICSTSSIRRSVLVQVVESATRETIGKSTMDFVLTEGRSNIVADIKTLSSAHSGQLWSRGAGQGRCRRKRGRPGPWQGRRPANRHRRAPGRPAARRGAGRLCRRHQGARGRAAVEERGRGLLQRGDSPGARSGGAAAAGSVGLQGTGHRRGPGRGQPLRAVADGLRKGPGSDPRTAVSRNPGNGVGASPARCWWT